MRYIKNNTEWDTKDAEEDSKNESEKDANVIVE